jgi:glycosyltransferase involved in cell wall biosynthesis
LLLVIPEERSFQGLFIDLALAARDAGMQVAVATRAPNNGRWLTDRGFKFVPIALRRGRLNPFWEGVSLCRMVELYRREQPAIVHHMFMKPILYGSWAARAAGVPAVVNTFAGLGFAFAAEGWRSRLLRAGLIAGLRSALTMENSRALFENSADRERLIRAKVVRPERAILNGAGIDIKKFTPMAEKEGIPIVLLASRMLWAKGIGDFVHAARLLKEQRVPGRFVLVGPPDPDNPTSVSEAQLLAWQQEGLVEWWGPQEDILPILASAHIIALPTFYGEGLPRILLEAQACARPVVGTTIPGCRAIVSDGENGFLVSPKDPRALAEAIRVLLEDRDLRGQMGACGRKKVVEEFSIEQVAHRTLELYQELLKSSWKGNHRIPLSAPRTLPC